MQKQINVVYADERMLAGSVDLWKALHTADSPVRIAVPGDWGERLTDPW